MREIKFKVWENQVRGTDPDAKERGIDQSQDWRDADVVLSLDGLRMYSRDEAWAAHSGAATPDWSKGSYLMRNSDSKIIIEFGGDPGEFFRNLLEKGLVLYGVAIGRDEQRHNA